MRPGSRCLPVRMRPRRWREQRGDHRGTSRRLLPGGRAGLETSQPIGARPSAGMHFWEFLQLSLTVAKPKADAGRRDAFSYRQKKIRDSTGRPLFAATAHTPEEH